MDGGRFRIEPRQTLLEAKRMPNAPPRFASANGYGNRLLDGESENADATPRLCGRCVGKGPFLWFVSFGPAKEMNSRVSAK